MQLHTSRTLFTPLAWSCDAGGAAVRARPHAPSPTFPEPACPHLNRPVARPAPSLCSQAASRPTPPGRTRGCGPPPQRCRSGSPRDSWAWARHRRPRSPPDPRQHRRHVDQRLPPVARQTRRAAPAGSRPGSAEGAATTVEAGAGGSCGSSSATGSVRAAFCRRAGDVRGCRARKRARQRCPHGTARQQATAATRMPDDAGSRPVSTRSAAGSTGPPQQRVPPAPE